MFMMMMMMMMMMMTEKDHEKVSVRVNCLRAEF